MTRETLLHLPAAPDTEGLVLGALMTDPEAVELVMAMNRDDFSMERHCRIWDTAKWCHDHGQAVERNTVAVRLQDVGHFESIGGLSYLIGLDEGLPRIYGLTDYIGTLRLKASLRRAAIAAHALVQRLCLDGADLADLRDAEALLGAIATQGEPKRTNLAGLGDAVAAAGGMDQFLTPSRAGAIPTPWPTLNEMLSGGGFLPGQLIVLGARPGLGKSAAAAMIARIAGEFGVALFSLEMSARENWCRIIASKAQVPLKALTNGALDEWQAYEVQRAMGELDATPIWIDDTTGANVPALVQAIKGRKVSFAIVDYLQLLSPLKRRQSRQEEVSEISRALKLAARQLKIPFLVLSQLSRESAKDDRAPELFDLRESGSIEQDADVVMMLHASRKEVSEAIAQHRPSLLDLIIRKQRNGATGSIGLTFNAAKMLMSERGVEMANGAR